MLLSAALLRVPARRLRALALGDDAALRDWVANESAWRLAETRRDVRPLAENIERAGARVISLGDATYPVGLRDLPDPPPFLIVRGTLAVEHAGTAIVGTREPVPEAARFAETLARVAPGPIVSGLALGIDAAAHRGALAAGVATIAYVAHGLGAVYPPEHAELEAQIVEAGGAVASERLPGEAAVARALVRRDRLQAAHGRAVVLVESDVAGGAMYTMRDARRLGRARFALADARFDGNALALAEGAAALPWDAFEASALIAGAANAAGLPADANAPRLF